MRILFPLCGRAGSKGIKSKNVKPFLGQPLIYYTMSAIDLFLKKHPEIEADIVASSDSEVLLDLAKNNPFGLEVELIERDPVLCGEVNSKGDAVADSYFKMRERKGIDYDMVIDMDIPSPLRTVQDIENLIETHTSTGADMTFSVAPARRSPYFNMVAKTEHGYKRVIESNVTARQQAPETFDMNASLYAFKPSHLGIGKNHLNGYCEIIVMYDTGILDLDHENDFELMQVIAKHLYETKPEFAEVYEHLLK